MLPFDAGYISYIIMIVLGVSCGMELASWKWVR